MLISNFEVTRFLIIPKNVKNKGTNVWKWFWLWIYQRFPESYCIVNNTWDELDFITVFNFSVSFLCWRIYWRNRMSRHAVLITPVDRKMTKHLCLYRSPFGGNQERERNSLIIFQGGKWVICEKTYIFGRRTVSGVSADSSSFPEWAGRYLHPGHQTQYRASYLHHSGVEGDLSCAQCPIIPKKSSPKRKGKGTAARSVQQDQSARPPLFPKPLFTAVIPLSSQIIRHAILISRAPYLLTLHVHLYLGEWKFISKNFDHYWISNNKSHFMKIFRILTHGYNKYVWYSFSLQNLSSYSNEILTSALFNLQILPYANEHMSVLERLRRFESVSYLRWFDFL